MFPFFPDVHGAPFDPIEGGVAPDPLDGRHGVQFATSSKAGRG